MQSAELMQRSELMQGQGKLIIVPTPIGNLGDMTERAKEALAAADVVCAEDTRVTAKLLNAYGIQGKLERLDEAVLGERAANIVERVRQGQTIAYCSDAGMPGVSDPGLRLVAAARDAGVAVEVLPGASAVTTAYVASGCTNPRFYFGGFMPRKDSERKTTLESIRALDAVSIFYESPNRLVASLRVIAAVFPTRKVAVCRELTKLHEEVFSGVASEVLQEFEQRSAAGQIKGEIALVIDEPSAAEGMQDAKQALEGAAVRAEELRGQGASKKDIVRALTQEFSLSRNDAYAIALGE